MTHHHRLLSIAVSLALAACATEPPATSQSISAVSCTPGQQICDVGCYYQGGPSTDDCIIQCNATGNGWITLTDCGYAQYWIYSASCKPGQPPVCEYN